MRRNGYTSYAVPLSEADFPATSPIALKALVAGAPIVWQYREAGSLEIPKCNVSATRFLHALARRKSRSVRSARTYGSHLAHWFRYCDETETDETYPFIEDVTNFCEWLQEEDPPEQRGGRAAGDLISVTSINGILCALVSYYKWAFKKHLVDWDPMLLTDRKGNLTLEFMIEEAIGTSEVTALSFVDHHQKMCSIDAMNCPNRGLSARKAAELYFSFLVGRGLKLPRNLITERRGKVTYLRDEVETAFEDIESRATASATFGGPITFNHSASGSLVRAILSEIARGSRIDRIAAASLFRSNDDLIKAIRREIRRVL